MPTRTPLKSRPDFLDQALFHYQSSGQRLEVGVGGEIGDASFDKGGEPQPRRAHLLGREGQLASHNRDQDIKPALYPQDSGHLTFRALLRWRGLPQDFLSRLHLLLG